jgi:hypothetical protein
LDVVNEKTRKPGDGKMSMKAVRFGCLLVIALAGQVAAIIIDDFDHGVNTALPPGVTRDTVGISTATDTGLSGVIGGVRELTVTAISIFLPPPFGPVTAGAAFLGNFFDLSCANGSQGEFALRYDRGGPGLNLSVYGFDHFQVTVVGADLASVPYAATVTVEDNQGRIESSTQTITNDGPRAIAWPLANFSGVDLNAVRSITLDVAPNFAADMRLDLFEIVGPPVSVPLLSPAAMLALVLVLGLLGLTRIVRSL